MALLLQQKGKHPTRVTFAASRKFCSTSSSSIANTELPKDMCVLDKRLDTWKNLNQHYSLINVIGSEGENHRQNYDLICEWIHKRFGRIFAYELVSNREVRQFKDLKPVFSSVSIFPDVAMYTDKQEVPLLLFEVHSSPYHQTLKKMVLVLMEHLRWLRNCDLSIVKWSGFCFPKNTEATCVTRVDINWDYHNFQFIVDFFPLESNAVEYDVGRTIDRHLKMVQKDTFKVPSGHLIGIPLGEEDLGVFGDGAYQLHSNNCIIVVHEDKVYKYIVDLNDRDTMKDQLLNCRTDLGDEQSLYQLPIGGKNVGLKYFLIFPMLIFPMKVIEARQCLPEFIESVVKAIQSMHQQPLQRAHLDIRLENICFRQLGSAFTGEIITNRLVECNALLVHVGGTQ